MSFEELTATRIGSQIPFARTAAALEASPDFLEQLPVAIYACDAEGRILWFNSRASELWGRTPSIGDDSERFCGSHRLYVDGLHLSREETPMAAVLRTGVAIRGVEGKVERPDGSCIWAMVHIEPVENENGAIIGAINCFHETTALHRAKEALHEQDGRLAATYDNAGIGIVEVDAEGRFLRVNAQLARLMGYAPEELLGRSMFDETHAEDVDPDHAQFRRQVAGEIDSYSIEKRIKQKDGGYFWAAITSSSVRDAENRFLYAVRVEYDISDRKRAEDAAQQLAAIVESSSDAIISKNLDGMITTWNRGAERLFGYAAEDVIGRPITILIPPDRLSEEPEILARIRRGERVDHYETIRQRKDGSLVDISLTLSPIRDGHGKIVGISKIARDISERKEIEAKLRDSKHRLQELLAAIPAAIYTTDADGKITYYNQAAVELAGRTPTLGTDEWCVTWKIYRPDGTRLPHDECPMAIALKEGRAIRNVEAVAERPDGTRVPFIPFPTPLRDANGTVVGAINMLIDISERKQAETQQQVLLNEVNHRVKNNMQMLQSLLHTAARQTQSAEAQQVLAEASGRLAAMGAAQRVLYGATKAIHFDAQEFLDAVCRTVQQTFSSNVKIICEADSSELSTDVAMPLALILNELLTNAIKHGLGGRGDGILRVSLTKESDLFHLYVEDDGPGFDLELVCNRSSGLRLVQGLARQLRGSFEVTRNPATRCSLHFS
jgi:PAS domain S-box-containing protein